MAMLMSGHRSCSMESQSAAASFLQPANQYQDNHDSSPNNSPGPHDDGKPEENPLKYSSSTPSPNRIHDSKKFNDAALKLENGVAPMRSFEVGAKGEGGKEGDDCKESTKKRERVENIVTSIMARDNSSVNSNNLFSSYETVSCVN